MLDLNTTFFFLKCHQSVPYKQAFAHVSSGKNIYQIRGKKKIRTHFLKPDKVLEFAGKNLKRNDQ